MWRRLRSALLPAAPEQPRPERDETPDALLRRLHWTVLRPLAAQLGGEERSVLRGPGLELHEIREYQPGDDVRHIDWNITARTEQPHVREAHAERALDVWLALDCSPSLDWGTARCLKRDRAREFTAIAGQLLGRRGNRVGALLFAEQPLDLLPPGTGRVHLLHLLAKQEDARRRSGRGPTDLHAALLRIGKLARRRALIVVVSDFLVPDGWQSPLGELAQRHEVIAVRLHDPREAALPDVGLITLEDPETGAQLIVNTHDRALRERYHAAAQAQAEQIQATFSRCGVDQLLLNTADDLLPAMVRFLSMRRLRRTLRGAHQAPAGAQRAALARR